MLTFFLVFIYGRKVSFHHILKHKTIKNHLHFLSVIDLFSFSPSQPEGLVPLQPFSAQPVTSNISNKTSTSIAAVSSLKKYLTFGSWTRDINSSEDE